MRILNSYAPTAVTPTTATAVTPEEAGTPAAAHEFCGDSQKIFNMAKTQSIYTQYVLSLLTLILSMD